LNSLLQNHSVVYLFLCDTSQLSAEFCKNRVNSGLDIGLENIEDCAVFHIYNHYWELYDFLESKIVSAFFTLGFEIVDTNVVKRSRIYNLLLLKVYYTSKELR